jgi:hypothetical protein
MQQTTARDRIENLWDRATPVGPLLDNYRAQIISEIAAQLAGMAQDAQATPRAYGMACAVRAVEQMATAASGEFSDLPEESRTAVRDQALAEAAQRQRDIARHLPEHLAGAAAIVTTAADVIDPGVQVLFQPARVRDAAGDYRDQVLTEAIALLRQHDGDEWWFDTRDRDAAIGLLAAARTTQEH